MKQFNINAYSSCFDWEDDYKKFDCYTEKQYEETIVNQRRRGHVTCYRDIGPLLLYRHP